MANNMAQSNHETIQQITGPPKQKPINCSSTGRFNGAFTVGVCVIVCCYLYNPQKTSPASTHKKRQVQSLLRVNSRDGLESLIRNILEEATFFILIHTPETRLMVYHKGATVRNTFNTIGLLVYLWPTTDHFCPLCRGDT